MMAAPHRASQERRSTRTARHYGPTDSVSVMAEHRREPCLYDYRCQSVGAPDLPSTPDMRIMAR